MLILDWQYDLFEYNNSHKLFCYKNLIYVFELEN